VSFINQNYVKLLSRRILFNRRYF